MQNKTALGVVTLSFVLLGVRCVWAIEPGPGPMASAFGGQDLHLVGVRVISYRDVKAAQSSQTQRRAFGVPQHILVFQDGFSMSIGDNRFSADSAVLWLDSRQTQYRGKERVEYQARLYLQGNVAVKKGKSAKTTDLAESVLEKGQALVAGFLVTGEVFITAGERQTSDPRGLELYKNALSAVKPTRAKPIVQAEALVPALPEQERPKVIAKKPGLIEGILGPSKKAAKKEEKPKETKKPRFQYPVSIAGVGDVEPKIESTRLSDGSDVATVIGRFYLWQKLDEQGNLLEIQADNAVIFYIGRQLEPAADSEQTHKERLLAGGVVKAIYLSGDIIITEGRRTIRADEAYYDFQRRQALAVNAVMRTFDVDRGIPIYLRAAKLRQIAQDKFAGENVTLTSSEFYLPSISLNASNVIVTDTTSVDEAGKRLSNESYDAQMWDVTMKAGKRTFFYWPYMRSNLERPDIPIKSLHASYDKTWGMSVESRWYLARLLGLREPDGVDSTFALDYYSKRGTGIGAKFEYKRENYFGTIMGYIIKDAGEDDLGRERFRRDIEPPRDLRGRFRLQHRQFLPHNWQLTLEAGYASDRYFIESYYRNEFNVGKEQETVVHLKRIQDNWGMSLLSKWRINDFVDKLEELPTAEFHWTGQSLFNDKFTLYSDSQISRFRQRFDKNIAGSTKVNQDHFTFMFNRTEIDMPMRFDESKWKVVPYLAGTFAYDDRSGFTRGLVDKTGTGKFGEDNVWIGEAGVRASTQYWKVYPEVKSRLWDIDGIRHIIKPQLVATIFNESDKVVEQHNAINISAVQRWQTKRGPADKRRTVDWMRLATGFTWVENSAGATAGPDKFIWNRQIIPMRVFSVPKIFHNDLTSNLPTVETYGLRRNSFDADYLWRITDTSAILSDLNYDMQSGVVQQYNIGFSRLRWPNLSYYIGSRYLRRINVLNERGSNAVTFAATYKMSPRYTVTYSTAYDFDYGGVIENTLTLIRQYNRVFFGISYEADHSLDRQAIIFSIWPQGVPELAIGPQRYVGLCGASSTD